MYTIVNALYLRILELQNPNPLVYLDLIITLAILIGGLLYLKKYPSFRVILGTIFIFFFSILLFLTGFIFTATLFAFFSILISISLPLIFSSEIRHYLGKIGRLSFIRLPVRDGGKKSAFITDLISAVFELAERKIGATLVIQRKTGLAQTVESGVLINANFNSKLLQSLFFPKNPLHDGAVVIKNNRIISAGSLLPISSEIKLDPPFGTRHKSALAITRDTDAVVVIVSEQRGEVSVAENGKLSINLDRSKLKELLSKLLS